MKIIKLNAVSHRKSSRATKQHEKRLHGRTEIILQILKFIRNRKTIYAKYRIYDM
jgi:hypothetical protein